MEFSESLLLSPMSGRKKKNAAHVALALALAFLSACAAEKAEESSIVIRGQLVSESTKKPLSGFLVAVGDAKPKSSPFGIRGADKFGAGNTDANGKFAVTIDDVAAYRKAAKGGQIALYLTGEAPVAGVVGFQRGESPVYLVPSIPGISSPTRE